MPKKKTPPIVAKPIETVPPNSHASAPTVEDRLLDAKRRMAIVAMLAEGQRSSDGIASGSIEEYAWSMIERHCEDAFTAVRAVYDALDYAGTSRPAPDVDGARD